MIHLLICFTTPATTPLFFLAQSVIMVTYNPDNRYSDGFATPMVSDSQKSRKTLMRSALPSAVNRDEGASQPRLFILQPNRRLSQPIWFCISLCADSRQNRPNFAAAAACGYFLYLAVKAAAQGDTVAHRGCFSFSTALPSKRSKQLSV